MTESEGSRVSVKDPPDILSVLNVPPLVNVSDVPSDGNVTVRSSVRLTAEANTNRGNTNNEAETPEKIKRVRFIV